MSTQVTPKIEPHSGAHPAYSPDPRDLRNIPVQPYNGPAGENQSPSLQGRTQHMQEGYPEVNPAEYNESQLHGPNPKTRQSPPQQPQMSLPPSPPQADPAYITFKGKTYALIAKRHDDTIPINPSVSSSFATLIGTTLKYGIPALEAQGIIVKDLSELKIIQYVKQEGEKEEKVELQYRHKTKNGKIETKTVELTDELILNSKDEKDVCDILPPSDSCKDHKHTKVGDTAKKTYSKAFEILFNRAMGDVRKPSPYELKPLSYDDLPEAFRTKHPKKDATPEKDDKPTDAKKADKPNKTDPKKEDPTKPAVVDKLSKEGLPEILKTSDRPEKESLSQTPEERTLDYIPELNNDELGGDEGKIWKNQPRWIHYLLNGYLRKDQPETDDAKKGDHQYGRSVVPASFTKEEAVKILTTLRNCRKRSIHGEGSHVRLIDFNEFPAKEQIFLKRLLVLLKKQQSTNKDIGEDFDLGVELSLIAFKIDPELTKSDSMYSPASLLNKTNGIDTLLSYINTQMNSGLITLVPIPKTLSSVKPSDETIGASRSRRKTIPKKKEVLSAASNESGSDE